MLISVTIMFTLRFVTDAAYWLNCHEIAGGESKCFGISAVFRGSFTLVIFHCLTLLLILPRADCCNVIHSAFWGFKVFILIFLYLASYWVPYEFFDSWGWFCLAMSAFYLMIQAYFFLSAAFTWNGMLESVPDSNMNYSQFLLLCYSVLSATGSIIWLVF